MFKNKLSFLFLSLSLVFAFQACGGGGAEGAPEVATARDFEINLDEIHDVRKIVDIKVDSFNRILVLAKKREEGAVLSTTVVFRLQPDGRVDTNFGLNSPANPDVKAGYYDYSVDVPEHGFAPQSLSIDAEGFLYIAGDREEANGSQYASLIKLSPNGLLVSDFGLEINGQVLGYTSLFSPGVVVQSISAQIINNEIILAAKSGVQTWIGRYDLHGVLQGPATQMNSIAGRGVANQSFDNSVQVNDFLLIQKDTADDGSYEINFNFSDDNIPARRISLEGLAIPNFTQIYTTATPGLESLIAYFNRDNGQIVLSRLLANGEFDSSFGAETLNVANGVRIGYFKFIEGIDYLSSLNAVTAYANNYYLIGNLQNQVAGGTIFRPSILQVSRDGNTIKQLRFDNVANITQGGFREFAVDQLGRLIVAGDNDEGRNNASHADDTTFIKSIKTTDFQ